MPIAAFADPFTVAVVRAEASAHFDTAEQVLATVMADLDRVWADTRWRSPAATAFRMALLEHIMLVQALQQRVANCRWEAGA